MPHLTLEYSPNLETEGDLDGLCSELAHCIDSQYDGATKVFPTGGIRVRAYACDHCAIADGSLEAAFVHANFRIGRGRSVGVRRATGAALMAVMQTHFEELYANHALALSVEVNEFNGLGTWKHNNLHERLKAAHEEHAS